MAVQYKRVSDIKYLDQTAVVGDKAFQFTDARFKSNDLSLVLKQVRHKNGMNVSFLDGHAEWKSSFKVPHIGWNADWARYLFWARADYFRSQSYRKNP